MRWLIGTRYLLHLRIHLLMRRLRPFIRHHELPIRHRRKRRGSADNRHIRRRLRLHRSRCGSRRRTRGSPGSRSRLRRGALSRARLCPSLSCWLCSRRCWRLRCCRRSSRRLRWLGEETLQLGLRRGHGRSSISDSSRRATDRIRSLVQPRAGLAGTLRKSSPRPDSQNSQSRRYGKKPENLAHIRNPLCSHSRSERTHIFQGGEKSPTPRRIENSAVWGILPRHSQKKDDRPSLKSCTPPKNPVSLPSQSQPPVQRRCNEILASLIVIGS
jgi:hypothetical protein